MRLRPCDRHKAQITVTEAQNLAGTGKDNVTRS